MLIKTQNKLVYKTKKNVLTLLLIAVLSNLAFSQIVNYEWGLSIGGSSHDYGISTTSDTQGNVYFVGEFSGTVDFDPGPDQYNITPNSRSIYMLKLDADGNFLWVKYIETRGVYRATTDTNGNIYIIGAFEGGLDFDPGNGVFYQGSLGDGDMFILKLDSNGDFQWAKRVGGISLDFGFDIKIDESGNIFAVGAFNDLVDFDPGNDTFYMHAPYQNNAYILKLDQDGDFVWAKQIEGDTVSNGTSLCFDSGGNIYVAGNFMNTFDFDPGSDTYFLNSFAGSLDTFILKINESGDFVWAKSVGGIGGDTGTSIATDSTSGIYIYGSYDYNVDFDPGPETYYLSSEGYNDLFILKLDFDGNFVWANSKGSDNHGDSAKTLTLDSFGNVYTTGGFNGTVDFDPGNNTNFLTSNGWADVFIQILDRNGNFIWATSMGDSTYDFGNDIHVRDQYIYTTGHYQYSIDLDPSNNVEEFISNGDTEIFGQKLSFPSMGVHALIQETLTIYPNPTTGLLNVETNEIISKNYIVYNIYGGICKQGVFTNDQIDISTLNPGIYLLSIDGVTFKIVKL